MKPKTLLPFLLATAISLSADDYGTDHTYPVFTALDADGSGTIEAAEIDQSNALLETLDSDNNGSLDQAELGGPGPFFGYLRLQTTIRVIDR
ncbi:MAG: hypothetical protein AAF236_14620, partial [Verrucomicrobiota bacterium]